MNNNAALIAELRRQCGAKEHRCLWSRSADALAASEQRIAILEAALGRVKDLADKCERLEATFAKRSEEYPEEAMRYASIAQTYQMLNYDLRAALAVPAPAEERAAAPAPPLVLYVKGPELQQYAMGNTLRPATAAEIEAGYHALKQANLNRLDDSSP